MFHSANPSLTYVNGDRLEQFRARHLEEELSQQIDVAFIDLNTLQHVNYPSPSRQIQNVRFSGNASLEYLPYRFALQAHGRPLMSIASVGGVDQSVQRSFPSNQAGQSLTSIRSTILTLT